MRISDWSSDVCSSDLLKKRISENTLNGALKRMGYQERLTGHGIRGTMSTALNEIGYPKVWVDAQLSHVDPNKVSATYNHAEYVEQRRRMRQDWADRLDPFEFCRAPGRDSGCKYVWVTGGAVS